MSNKYKSEILYRVPINVVKCLEKQYTKLENSYYVHIDTTKMTDDKSIMISIRSIEGFRRGDYDMITAHIEDLIEDEYRRRKRNRRQNNKEIENKVKETIPIEEAAIAFVIGRNKSNIKRICGKFKDAGVFIECPKRGSGSVEFTISARSAKIIDEVIMMLLESEEMALKKTKKKQTKSNELKTERKESESENDEETKVVPEPEYKPTTDNIEHWGDI